MITDAIERIRQRLDPEQVADRLARTDPWSYLTAEQRIALENVVRFGMATGSESAKVQRARKSLVTHANVRTEGCLILLLWDRAVRTNLERP